MQRLIVDGMNVIGSRPTGWWRDRDAAALRLTERLRALAAATDDEVSVVFDGRPIDLLPEGDAGGVAVFYAARRGPDAADDRIVELVEQDDAPRSLEVVTSDRRLRERVRALGATVSSPSALLRELDGVAGSEGSSEAGSGGERR